MASRCCQCADPASPVCRTQITSADLATLLYTAGLDVNLCEKFAPVVAGLSLVDCLGTPITIGTPVVTCADFRNRLCITLAALTSGGPLTLNVTEVIGKDCLTHTVPETPLVVVDTPSVNLTSSGAFGHTLQADVIISPDAGNATTIHPNGVFTPSTCSTIAAAIAGVPVAFGVTPLVGSDCLTHVVNETPFTFTDTTTIDGTTSGAFGHDLTAVVKIDPGITNLITIGVGGLQVLCASVQNCVDICAKIAALVFNGTAVPGVTRVVGADCKIYDLPAVVTPVTVNVLAQDTPCFDMTVTQAPVGTFTVSGSPIISPTVGNVLTCSANGLFVPASAVATPVTVLDTPSVDLNLVGQQISANVIISPNVGNQVSIQPNGLFVPDTIINTLDTPCLNLDIIEGPANTFVLTGNPILSPAANNVLSCTPQGLFVPPAQGVTTCADITALLPSGGPLIAGQTVIGADCTIKTYTPPTCVETVALFTPGPIAGIGQVVLGGDCQLHSLPNIIAVDTQCINTNVTFDGTNFSVGALPIIAPTYGFFGAGCNSLVCQADGLAAPPEYGGFRTTVITGGDQFVGVLATGSVFVGPTTQLSVINPSPCRDAVVVIALRFPSTDGTGGPGASWQIHEETFYSVNFPAVAVFGPTLLTQSRESGVSGQQVGHQGSDIVFVFLVPPSFGGTFSSFTQVTSEKGNYNFSLGAQRLSAWVYAI